GGSGAHDARQRPYRDECSARAHLAHAAAWRAGGQARACGGLPAARATAQPRASKVPAGRRALPRAPRAAAARGLAMSAEAAGLQALIESNAREAADLAGELILLLDRAAAEPPCLAAARMVTRRLSDRLGQVVT